MWITKHMQGPFTYHKTVPTVLCTRQASSIWINYLAKRKLTLPTHWLESVLSGVAKVLQGRSVYANHKYGRILISRHINFIPPRQGVQQWHIKSVQRYNNEVSGIRHCLPNFKSENTSGQLRDQGTESTRNFLSQVNTVWRGRLDLSEAGQNPAVDCSKMTFIFRKRMGLPDELNADPFLSNSIPQSSRAVKQSLGLQEADAPRISSQSAHEGDKVVSPTHRLPLLPRKHSSYSFLLEAQSTPPVLVRPEGLSQRKILITPTGNKPVTFRLVAQCLNQLLYRLTCSTVVDYINIHYNHTNFLNIWSEQTDTNQGYCTALKGALSSFQIPGPVK